jgi:hypothetical protein
MKMKTFWSFRIAALAVVLVMSVGLPQAQSSGIKQNQMGPAAVNSSVKGTGTVDHISKWVGDGQIGDSAIVETGGKVTITASVPVAPFPDTDGVLNVQNIAQRGNAMHVKGTLWGLVADGADDAEIPGSGVLGEGGNNTSGSSTGGTGVLGFGGEGAGESGFGVVARGGGATGAGNRSGTGILAVAGFGIEGAATGLAGQFVGDVEVTGTLSAATKNFKIDHPLDPENKYLYHTSVESPDMKNIYDGNVVTDENGEATVKLPDYFEVLNRDFRYQLTVIGAFAQAIIADEIKSNRFVIRTNAPNVKVSWQVTGIRRDAWANMNRIKVEEDKPVRERGSYLHPEAFNQPEERGIESRRGRKMTMQLKQAADRANHHP